MRKRFHLPIAILAVLAIVGALSSGKEPVFRMWHKPNALIFSLCVGYLVSFIFWLMVVFLPEHQRRRVLRENLSERYQLFRRDVVGILLNASIGPYSLDEAERLSDYEAFRNFFGANQKEMWYAALNGLQSNEYYLHELLVEIEMLSDEVAYVLNNVNINDSAVFEFFKNLSGHVYRLKNSPTFTDDQVKYLGSFVWGILAQWSFIDGRLQEDIIQKMISQI